MRQYNRKNWELSAPLPINALPKWPCPYCDTGTIALDAESFDFRPSSKTKVQATGGDFLYALGSILLALDKTDLGKASYWQCGLFNAFLQCASCKQHVAVSGAAQKWNQSGLPPKVIPSFFSPTLCIVPLRTYYPAYIRDELLNASAQYLIRPGLAGNSIRRLVERFTNELLGKEQSKKPLHKKIEKLESEFPTIGKTLMSLKWLGNVASHGGDIEQSDVLDAFQILSFILDDYFHRKVQEKRMLEMASSLTEKHGVKPRSDPDALPPKLISGELRIEDAEKMVEGEL